MSVSLAVKEGLGFLARACNILDKISSNPPKSIVLGYHRVLPPESEQLSFCAPGMYVTPDTLRQHLVFLRRHYKLVRFNDLIDQKIPEKCCAVTFDDGWSDNYSHAYPILKELDVPATIFLTTGFVESQQWPWPDRLMYYVNSVGYNEVEQVINEKLKVLGCFDTRGAVRSIDCLINSIKLISHTNILQLMEFVDRRYSVQYKKLHFNEPALTWENVREMKKTIIDYGLHSHDHIIANKATSASLLKKDYSTAYELFYSKMSEQPRIFAYPNGNYNNEAIQILNNLSIDISVTTQPGVLNLAVPMSLNRILLHEDVSSSEALLTFKLIISLWGSIK